MFRIRKEQMDRLGESTRARFVAMMHDYLRSYFTSWVGELSDDELSTWLGEALAKADRYGVRTEPEAAQLILLLIVLGLDADETTEWARQVLADEDLVAIGRYGGSPVSRRSTRWRASSTRSSTRRWRADHG
ncbi:MAG: hypothetical protein JRI23_01495 [Deltaproteobacteria bacterium]|jgi:hypothetical protein|nr:hypothetical protein [Deltaproteobacteria bacterium]MBW2530136.1 hypothetical protein [Deltaproteobacteria bacterium]